MLRYIYIYIYLFIYLFIVYIRLFLFVVYFSCPENHKTGEGNSQGSCETPPPGLLREFALPEFLAGILHSFNLVLRRACGLTL